MIHKHSLFALSVLGTTIALAQPAQAQRSGFIIGFGAGIGRPSWTASSPFVVGSTDRESKVGVATDFKIGAVIGDLFQLYYVNKVIFFSAANVDLIATGMSGIGFTYPLPSSPDFYFNGGIGIGVWTELDFEAATTESISGLGLLAGVGYHLNELWMLDFDVMYGKPGDDTVTLNTLSASLTINILSR